MTQSVSSKSIQSLAASKVTGALPAVDGSALTGISAGVYNNTSDPAITSNRDLGTLWANSVSGNLFVCTDATSNNNVWRNVGGGDYHIATAAFGGNGPGSVSGYSVGGNRYPSVPNAVNNIDKFSFSSNGNATNVGTMATATDGAAPQSSSTHGYASGSNSRTNIEKLSFSTDGNSSIIAALSILRNHPTGQSSHTHGYTTGGGSPVIDRFAFASDADATNIGNSIHTEGGGSAGGQSSSSHGYQSGGYDAGSSAAIGKFSFWGEVETVNVGSLTTGLQYCAGQSSSINGYISGGYPATNVIDKFSFSSDGNATDIANLSVARQHVGGQSSTASGYTSGGNVHGDVIDKFSFSSDSDATDVGNLTLGRYQICGVQV